MSKAAAHMAGATLAADLRASGVAVGIVHPGTVQSPNTHTLECTVQQWTFLAEISVTSPRKLFLFHYLENAFLEQRSKHHFLNSIVKYRSNWCPGIV